VWMASAQADDMQPWHSWSNPRLVCCWMWVLERWQYVREDFGIGCIIGMPQPNGGEDAMVLLGVFVSAG